MKRCPLDLRARRVCCALATLALLLCGALAPTLRAQDAAPNANADPAPRQTQWLEKETQRGPVTATVRLSPAAPVIGDDLTLELVIRAERGVELILPEFGEALERFRISSFEPSESVTDDGDTIATQRYQLLGPRSGPHAIPPLLVEFLDRRPGKKLKPEGEPSYELLTERLDFAVESVVPDAAMQPLQPALGKLEKLAPPPPPRWPWVVGGIVLALIALPFLVRGWVAYRRRARRRSAYDIAQTKLRRLLDAGVPTKDEAAIDSFYVELSGIVRRYLEDRFELRAPELTTEEFLEQATLATDLTPDHQRLLTDFLRGADLVKFAHQMPDAATIDRSIESVRRFLDDTRENAPLLDLDETSSPPSGSDRTEAVRGS